MLSFYLSLLETEEEKKKMTEIYEQYRYYCIFIAKKLLDNHEDAEDAAHSAFIEIIKHKQKYFALECSDFRASLVVIVKNKAIDILRRRKKESADGADALGDVADDAPSAVEILSYQEEYNLLRKALKNITPSYSNVLTLKYFEDMSNAEIADTLDTNKKNVEVMLYRAKLSLRKELEKLKGASNEASRL